MLTQMTDHWQRGRGYVWPRQSSHSALWSPSPGPTQQYTSDDISDTHTGQPLDHWNPLFHKWKFDACQDPVQAKVLRQGDVRWHKFKHDAHNQPRASSDCCHKYYISQLATQVPQEVFFSYVGTHRARFSMKVPVRFSSGVEKMAHVLIDIGAEINLIRPGFLPGDKLFGTPQHKINLMVANEQSMRGGELHNSSSIFQRAYRYFT